MYRIQPLFTSSAAHTVTRVPSFLTCCSHQVLSDCSQSYGLQHARLPYPSPAFLTCLTANISWVLASTFCFWEWCSYLLMISPVLPKTGSSERKDLGCLLTFIEEAQAPRRVSALIHSRCSFDICQMNSCNFIVSATKPPHQRSSV